MFISSADCNMPAPQTQGMMIFGASALNPKHCGFGKLACSKHFRGVFTPIHIRCSFSMSGWGFLCKQRLQSKLLLCRRKLDVVGCCKMILGTQPVLVEHLWAVSVDIVRSQCYCTLCLEPGVCCVSECNGPQPNFVQF